MMDKKLKSQLKALTGVPTDADFASMENEGEIKGCLSVLVRLQLIH